MKFIAQAAAISLAAFCMSSVSASADDCGPLQRMASFDTVPVGNSGRMLMPVIINGTPKQMLLDTAAGVTAVTQATVAALGLHPMDSRIKLLDASGNASQRYVKLDTFQMGNMLAKDLNIMVSGNPNAGQALQIDGVIAGDMMSRYDVELDFASHKVNYFSPDHCEGHVVYWPAAAVAVVPITLNRPVRSADLNRRGLSDLKDTHIRVPVTLDGKNFMAVINTGAANSTMSARTAKFVFDVTADSPGSVPLGMVDNDPKQKIFGHVFSTLAFEGVTVTNPHIAIRPDLFGAKDPDNNFVTGSHIAREDDDIGSEVTIGMDVLKRLHLYIAYREDKLYITPAAAPAADATASAAKP